MRNVVLPKELQNKKGLLERPRTLERVNADAEERINK
jgi:hypothetical protein